MATKEQMKKIREFNQEREKRLFEQAQNALQLVDLTRNESRTYTTFNKEVLRNYLQNPYNNQSNIRELSRYLYRILGTYKRIVDYYAKMVDMSAYSVVPNYDITQDPDKEAIRQQYMMTIQKLENMGLKTEYYKIILETWLVGVAYGVVWESDEDDEFLITLLDPAYCKVASANFDGTYNYAFDFSYFRSHATQLEYYGDPFVSMYNAYTADPSNMRWQELPSEIQICLLYDSRDPALVLPPFTPLFEDLCDLSDLRSIQAARDELSIYKLLVAQMETISSSDTPDDFSVSPDVAIRFINKMADQLDERIGLMISPLPISLIDFKTDDTGETDKISNSIKNVLLNSGGAQILLGDSISGTTAYRNAMIADMEFGLHPILDQIERWLNHHLRQVLTDPARVVMIHTSPYFKEETKDSFLKSAQYGIPNKIAVATLDGFSPMEIMSMSYLENDILDLANTWVPLSSSFTKSADSVGSDPTQSTDPLEGGRPESDEPLSDEGENTKEKK